MVPAWWRPPRTISVVVDNDSWILPYAQRFVASVDEGDDEAHLCRNHRDVRKGTVAFYLGCINITPPEVLDRNQRNLVVHASNLPKGRGFSPLTWQVLAGQNEIPVCLIDAVDEVDSGAIVIHDRIRFCGHELIEEMRKHLGNKTIEICEAFLAAPFPADGKAQHGEPSYYPRRRPHDSRLDPFSTIEAQFDLLRVVDNERYPAFFEYRGHRYRLRIDKFTSERE